MARRLPVVLALVLASTLLAVVLDVPAALRTADAAASSQNDAGSRSDAGNTPSEATLVGSAKRAYTANLTPPGTDADWYRHATTQAFCSVATPSTSTAGQTILTTSADGTGGASRFIDPHTSMTLALAAPAGRIPFFGFEPGLTSASKLIGEDTRDRDPGRYTFSFESFRYPDLDPENDGETPEAGATAALAAPAPGACFAGRLATADQDWFSFDVASAREVTATFALAGAGTARLELRSPSGALAATVASGGAQTVWAGETGRWHLVVLQPTASGASALAPLALAGAPTFAPTSSTLPDDYIIGLTDGPDPSNPCRPACR